MTEGRAVAIWWCEEKGQEKWGRGTNKRHGEMSGEDEYVYYPDCCDVWQCINKSKPFKIHFK